MKNLRKVYQVGVNAFIYKKNAQAESKTTNEEIKTVELDKDQFKFNLDNSLFSDYAEFDKKVVEAASVKMVHLGTKIYPPIKEEKEENTEKKEDSFFEDVPDLEPESSEETTEMQDTIKALTKRLDSLEAENKELKTKTTEKKELSFEEASKIYKDKADKLKYLSVFEATKNKLEDLPEFKIDEDSPTDATSFRIKFIRKGSYNEETLYRT